MKKTSVKLTALGLSGALALGGVGGAVCARAASAPGSAAPVTLSAAEPASGPAAYRDETVYVLAGPDGAVEKIIVSDWLKNPEGLDRLEDAAVLDQVEDVKGGAAFSPDGPGRIWEANGGDVYSQGTSDQDLPVEVSVRYTLDGRPIDPEQLAGKSGRVSIRFDYVNRQYQEVSIGGETERICVPFAMITAVALDSGRFANVDVANGRLCNDGDRLAVVGLALPGVRESLGLDEEDFDLPEYLEITADVTDFRLETTFTAAVCEPFARLDTEKLSDAEGLGDALAELEDAMNQLLEGSGRLYDGLEELLEKSGGLASGVEQLAGGAASLQSGADALQSGAAQLKDGSAALQAGLDQLAAQNDTLNGGAEQMFQSLLDSAARQLTAAGVQVPELTADNYAQVLDGAAASLGDSPAARQIAGVKASLDSCHAFCQGLRQYADGVAQASGGAAELASGAEGVSQGADTLSQGAAQLGGGIQSLQSSLPALTDGVARLRDGAGELDDGLREFNDKGVRKILDTGDLTDLADRLEAMSKAADGCRSFAGGNEAGGQVKFLYRTAPITAEEP